MIGAQLAHFRITEKLGEGGMGVVYGAEDAKLGRRVAIKILPELFTRDAERLARFEREARVLASLSHPHIAAIFEVGEAQDVHFLVMELAPGETLAERLARGPLAVEEALRLALQIASALAAAHDKGVVHRDLKPANVMVADGKVKVLDFGLAKTLAPATLRGETALTQAPTLTAPMTEAGTVLGTANYMSPEQARGHAVDKRTDVWALGCVLMEMLTGQKAFPGNTFNDVFAAIVAREPAWESLPPRTPRAVRRLLRRCLAKDPEHRLRDLADARIELEEALAAGSAEPEPAAVAGRRPWGWLAATAVLTVAVVALGIQWLVGRVAAPVIRSSIPAPEGTTFYLGLTHHPGPVAVSPDGRRLAFAARDQEDGTIRLWVRDLAEPAARPLPGTEGAGYSFWSPDSRELGFFAAGALKKVDASGGPPLTLCAAADGKGGTWNAAGTIVFAPTIASPLHRVSAAGGDSTPLTVLDAERHETSHRYPRFLPDGAHLLYLARVAATGPLAEENRLMIASLAGEPPRELMRGYSNTEYASGHLLFVREGNLMAQPFEARRLVLTGDPFPIAESVWQQAGASLGVFSASDNGVLAYQSENPRSHGASLTWRQRSGEEGPAVDDAALYLGIRLSPDGRGAAASIVDPESGGIDIWIWNLDRQLRTRFTFDPATDMIMAWSPDGSLLAFASERTGRGSIFVKPIEGGGEETLLYQDERDNYPLGWTPDGRYLLFTSFDSKQADTWALPVGEEGARPLPIRATKYYEAGSSPSPDGRWVAYWSDESGRNEVYVTAFPQGGRKWQVSTTGGAFPVWRADGRELFYVTDDNTYMAAEVDGSGDTFRVGEVVELFEGPPMPTRISYGYDVTADGERFLVIDTPPPEALPPLSLVVNWPAGIKRE